MLSSRPIFAGVDVGSLRTKIALLDADNKLVGQAVNGFVIRRSMNRNKDRNMDVELVEVSHLDLEVEGIEIFPNTSFSIKKHRGYLITGPNEETNVLLLKIIGGIVPPQSVKTRVVEKVSLSINRRNFGGESQCKGG